jgi:hypothetical protein
VLIISIVIVGVAEALEQQLPRLGQPTNAQSLTLDMAPAAEVTAGRSDWMAVEHERGVSVSLAMMSFEHEGLAFKLLRSGCALTTMELP